MGKYTIEIEEWSDGECFWVEGEYFGVTAELKQLFTSTGEPVHKGWCVVVETPNTTSQRDFGLKEHADARHNLENKITSFLEDLQYKLDILTDDVLFMPTPCKTLRDGHT